MSMNQSYLSGDSLLISGRVLQRPENEIPSELSNKDSRHERMNASQIKTAAYVLVVYASMDILLE